MTLAQGILLIIIGSGLWYWSKDWDNREKGMLILWLIAMGGIIWMVGPDSVEILPATDDEYY